MKTFFSFFPGQIGARSWNKLILPVLVSLAFSNAAVSQVGIPISGPGVIVPTSTTFQFTSPQSGASFQRGSLVNIRTTGGNLQAKMTVEFSANGGFSYTNIGAKLTRSSFGNIVRLPYELTNFGRIRVSLGDSVNTARVISVKTFAEPTPPSSCQTCANPVGMDPNNYKITNVTVSNSAGTSNLFTYNSTSIPNHISSGGIVTVQGYGDYFSLTGAPISGVPASPSLTRGVEYIVRGTITVPAGKAGRVGIWANWDNNCNLSQTNEFLGIPSYNPPTSTSTTTTISFSRKFTVPASAAQGLLRLRVRLFGNTSIDVPASNSCLIPATNKLGETEDYRINIPTSPSTPPSRQGVDFDSEEISNTRTSLSLSVFPNPTIEGHYTQFSIEGINNPETSFIIIDALGRNVFSKTINDADLTGSVKLEAVLPKGYYLVRISSKGGQLTDRFIVQ